MLGPQEAAEDLVLELWDGAELMGKGSVPISALWDSLEEVETILLDVHGNIEVGARGLVCERCGGRDWRAVSC